MTDYKKYFQNKKITVAGLGLLGRGVGDVGFLARAGADLLVTDLKAEEELKESLKRLERFPDITYVLGEHRLEDFRDCDMVVKAAGIPLDSPYIAEARKHGVPIEMSTVLFARLSGALLIGVTGTRGKSTVTHLIYEILKSDEERSGRRVHLGGNILGVSTLALLDEVKKGDLVVLELDSWQLQGFGESKISPHVAIFTNLMSDHMNYYHGDMVQYWKDKVNIFKYQKDGDIIITHKEMANKIEEELGERGGAVHTITGDTIPKDWTLGLIGKHNRDNIALAVTAARFLDVPEEMIAATVEEYQGVSGRLELIREIDGIKIYNDTTSTAPDATRVALEALKSEKEGKHIVLIMGGSDKELDMSALVGEFDEVCKAIVLLPGSGTDKLDLTAVEADIVRVESMEEAVEMAHKKANVGDTILLSPAFASFGLFKNEFDRGNRFNELIKSL